MISVQDALAAIRAVIPSPTREDVNLDQALDRVLALDLSAAEAVPPFDNSAMDGFALRAEDVVGASPECPVRLRLRGGLPAGEIHSESLASGEVLRIMTGAPLPAGTDAVAVQERCRIQAETVEVEYAPGSGSNIRRRGEDLMPGDPVFSSGRLLGPGEIGLLASLGLVRIPVCCRPRVTILATGNELVPAGESIQGGKIRNSNSPLLAAFCRRCGALPVDLGIARDDPAELRKRLAEGLTAPVLLVTGGASVGDHDHTRPLLTELGVRFLFESVAIRPGKPFACGLTEAGGLVFALPGNPGAVAVIAEVFLRPTLARLQGRSLPGLPLFAPLAEPVRKRPGLRYFLKGCLDTTTEELRVRSLQGQGSGMLRSYAHAELLIELAEEWTEVAAGTRVPFRFLDRALS